MQKIKINLGAGGRIKSSNRLNEGEDKNRSRRGYKNEIK